LPDHVDIAIRVHILKCPVPGYRLRSGKPEVVSSLPPRSQTPPRFERPSSLTVYRSGLRTAG